jgi:D-alanine-D-alanine ligase
VSEHVAVLMGGWSAEREVSLVSGQAVSAALKDKGWRVTDVDVGRDVATVLTELAPDIVFNALHGPWGEDGCIQGVCEILDIPYTHSGVLASASAMNKAVARRLFAAVGITCAEGQVADRGAAMEGRVLPTPFVVKPLNEGSSVGVEIIMDDDALSTEGSTAKGSSQDQVLVEKFIPGREITVAVMGDRALGVLEIIPGGDFYDYESKYTAGKFQHLLPAPIHAEAYDEAMSLALLAHQTLGCRGVTRADLRYDDTAGEPGELYMLEVNTQPGLTPLSLVPEIAAFAGTEFGDLVEWMVEDAGCDR